ncbi:fimbrial protein [Dyella sp. A6]|uniref:fimbrial protein n=1 Tax=Dyella aluminiiresistens TaxID=3069105 RepID=UPI002E78B429|nr:fimbrial protein [Dyella sp. A6]
MNKTLLSTTLAAFAIASGMLAYSPMARAVQNSSPDGTITFNGLVVANTCTVNANGSGSTGGTVTLPTVYTSSLAAAGATAGDTAFNISVSGCDKNLSNVTTYWSGTNVNTNGRLTNLASSNNVDVQLLNSGDTSSDVINLNGAQGSQNSKTVNLDSTGAATLNYYARYYATAAATSGKVNTSVSFTMVYQ